MRPTSLPAASRPSVKGQRRRAPGGGPPAGHGEESNLRQERGATLRDHDREWRGEARITPVAVNEVASRPVAGCSGEARSRQFSSERTER